MTYDEVKDLIPKPEDLIERTKISPWMIKAIKAISKELLEAKPGLANLTYSCKGWDIEPYEVVTVASVFRQRGYDVASDHGGFHKRIFVRWL